MVWLSPEVSTALRPPYTVWQPFALRSVVMRQVEGSSPGAARL